MPKKIRPKQPGAGAYIKHEEKEGASTLTKNPHFSFQHLRRTYCVQCCNVQQLAGLARKLRVLGQMTWADILKSGRHAAGTETISVTSIREGERPHANGHTLLAFRFSDMHAMVGYRVNETFHIVWLDYDFSLYPH